MFTSLAGNHGALNDDRDGWQYDAQWYRIDWLGLVGDRDGRAVEWDDIGPAPGRGVVLEFGVTKPAL